MALLWGKCLILQFCLLMQICLAAGEGAAIKIDPGSFLPDLTLDVQMICRPPAGEDIAKVLTLQLYRQREGGLGREPLASYVTSESPLAEVLATTLNASVSGSYDPAHPKSAFLSVHLPRPPASAEGTYTCSVEVLDRSGVIHSYSGYSSLVSIGTNETVPLFYQVVLRELRSDLDTLTYNLQNVTDTQVALAQKDIEEQAKLSTLDAKSARINGLISDASSYLSDVDQRVASVRTALDRLRDITPTTPVKFYSYYSANYFTPSVNSNIVFNTLDQNTDTSYSRSTGVFTAPVNGTYYFRTGITGNANTASIVVNDLPVASLKAYDDYVLQQATASVVAKLEMGDTVRVVKKSGTSIYGYYPNSSSSHLSYFMGLLLW